VGKAGRHYWCAAQFYLEPGAGTAFCDAMPDSPFTAVACPALIPASCVFCGEMSPMRVIRASVVAEQKRVLEKRIWVVDKTSGMQK
jgi:hypothetical protein